MSIDGKTTGIVPGDIILKTGLMEGLADLRRHPELLDDVFRTIELDDPSKDDYGTAEATRAKEWFRETGIDVRITDGLEPPNGTCVTLQASNGQETEMTTADTHYETTLPAELPWPALAGPLNPVSYDPATGTLTMPSSLKLVVVPGMTVVDRTGRTFPVVSVPEPRTLVLGAGVQGDFVGMTVKGAPPAVYREAGSVEEEETWQVGVHAFGDSVYLAWLFPIVRYVLYRLRESLETRGLEQVRYAWTGPEKDGGFGTENLYSRYFTVTYKCRATWIKRVAGVFTSVGLDVRAGSPFGDAPITPRA